MVPKKTAKFENPGQNFSEMSFVIYSVNCKIFEPKFFYRKLTRNLVDEIVIVKF